MPSPTCTVNSTATTNGVNVSAASTVNIALADTAGVTTWTLECIGRDDDAAAPTITINSVNKTATFTSGAAGSAYVLKSTVNGGRDANGTLQTSYSTTFSVYVLVGGARVVASNETTEGNPTHGWTEQLNTVIRRPGSAWRDGGSPSAGLAGRILVDNASVVPMYVDDGTEWRPVLGGSLGYVPPTVSNFTWTNQDTSTATDRGWTVELSSNSNIGISYLTKAVPSAPYTLTACFRIGNFGPGGDDVKFGLCLAAAGAPFITFGPQSSSVGELTLAANNWDNTSTLNATTYTQLLHLRSDLIWLRIQDNNTNRILMYSYDGRNFIDCLTVARTSFITPTKIGVFIADNNGEIPTVTLVSWKAS